MSWVLVLSVGVVVLSVGVSGCCCQVLVSVGVDVECWCRGCWCQVLVLPRGVPGAWWKESDTCR